MVDVNIVNDLLGQNKTVISEFLAAFSRGDISATLSYLDENCIWWISGNVPGISGSYSKIQMGELLSGVVDFYQEGCLPISPGVMTAEGNRVAVEATSCSQLKNGKVFQNAYHFLFEVEGKRIMSIREYSDTLHMYEIFVSE